VNAEVFPSALSNRGNFLDRNPHSQLTSTDVFQFPADTITDEDTALTWWEQEFAPTCEALGAQVNAALLVRKIVASLRLVRETALAETLSLTEAAERTGYSANHIGRLVRQGRLPNAGRKNAPRVRLGDLTLEVKPKLAGRSVRMYDPLSDARSLRVRR
jgi:hypothetical protein